jgi:phosphoglycerate kinase
MNKLTVRDIDVKGKRVVVRVDYNVPVQNGRVGDPLRIQASFDTLNYLLEQGCSLVLLSHLGEPKGAPDPKFSLEPVAKKASELLGRPIKFAPDCVGPEVVKVAANLQPGEVMLCENVRFHQEELDNDDEFGKQLAGLGEVYVNDAFAAIHRKQASLVAITQYLPSAAGLLVEKEVDTISQALENPKRPLVAIVGGAKVSSKIEVLNNLLTKVNTILVGGAMANTFYAAQGLPVGKSLYEPDFEATAKEIVKAAQDKGVKLVLPQTVVVSKSLERPDRVRTLDVADVEDDDLIVDATPEFADQLGRPGTVIWNGPVGVTEIAEFAKGSRQLVQSVINSGAQTIIGGGDTAAFVDQAGLADRFDWVSTGGGASLELMAGKELPGLAALPNKN